MPEFVLDTDNAPEFDALPEITQSFIETLFFMHQNTTGVAVNMGTMESRWLTMEEVANLDDPQPIKAHWMHPDIQDRLTEGQLDGDIPADCGAGDLHPDTLKHIAAHVAEWYAKNRDLADRAADLYGMDRVGSDLAFTESGAGVGFWDRSELEEDGLGDKLADTCDRSEWAAYYDPESGKISFD